MIKHRDEAAHDDDRDRLLKDSHSIASGRTMREIAQGTGMTASEPQSAMRSKSWEEGPTARSPAATPIEDLTIVRRV